MRSATGGNQFRICTALSFLCWACQTAGSASAPRTAKKLSRPLATAAVRAPQQFPSTWNENGEAPKIICGFIPRPFLIQRHRNNVTTGLHSTIPIERDGAHRSGHRWGRTCLALTRTGSPEGLSGVRVWRGMSPLRGKAQRLLLSRAWLPHSRILFLFLVGGSCCPWPPNAHPARATRASKAWGKLHFACPNGISYFHFPLH